jgi:hyperosmotically inducible periplasmic protein
MNWRSGLAGMFCVALAGGAAWAEQRPVSDPPSRADGVAPADAERARSIEAQLRADPDLRDDEVAITVTGKRVRLSGSVDNAAERVHAEEMVRESDPTLTVENLLVTSGERKVAATADRVSEGTKKAAKTTEKAANEVGGMVSDGWITSKVKSQLVAADGVRASAINVDTAGGVVTLRGTVRSEAERQKALSLARQTRGVQTVIDELHLIKTPR